MYVELKIYSLRHPALRSTDVAYTLCFKKVPTCAIAWTYSYREVHLEQQHTYLTARLSWVSWYLMDKPFWIFTARAGTRRINQSGFCYSRDDGTAAVSAGPCASHLRFALRSRQRDGLGIENISTVLQKNRLRWFERVQRKPDNDWTKRCMEYPKLSGPRL